MQNETEIIIDEPAAIEAERVILFECDACHAEVDSVQSCPTSPRFLCTGCMPLVAARKPYEKPAVISSVDIPLDDIG